MLVLCPSTTAHWQAKDKMLTETLENISRHRKEKTKAAVERCLWHVCVHTQFACC